MPLYVAVEVDFILALIQGDEIAQEAADIVTKIRGHVLVSPSAMQELQDQAVNQTDSVERTLATKALNQLSTLGFLTPPLEPLKHGVASITADKLMAKGFCQTGGFQSALILSEAACLHCRLLLSYQKELNDIDPSVIRLAFLEADLTDCFVVNPCVFVAFFSD